MEVRKKVVPSVRALALAQRKSRGGLAWRVVHALRGPAFLLQALALVCRGVAASTVGHDSLCLPGHDTLCPGRPGMTRSATLA